MSGLPAVPPDRLALRAYRALLWFYPLRYRQAYGPAMAQLFRDLLRDAERTGAGTPAALLWLWLRVLADTVRSAGAEHWVELRRSWLRGLCGFDGQPMVSWPAFGLAVLLIVGAIVAKALVLRATGSVAASVAVFVLGALFPVLLLDRAMASRGRVLAAGLLITGSMLVPLAWTPDAAAWLSKNPLTVYTLLWLPFGWRWTGRQRSKLWVTVTVLAGINLFSALLVGP
jgi:hypothetical protein